MQHEDVTSATVAILVRRTISDVNPLDVEEEQHLQRMLDRLTPEQFATLMDSVRHPVEAATDGY